MAKVTLYFSKVSINSHILEVYEDKVQLNDILQKIYLDIRDGIEFKREDLINKEDGETYLYDATYEFNFIEKLGDEFIDKIFGSVVKTATLFVNDIDEDTGEVKKIPIENKEIIHFYFDVYQEIVVFHTKNRFGYNEFNLAFGELISLSMLNTEEDYNFKVSLIKEGLDVRDIKDKLLKIGKVKSLKIEVIPPNADEDLIRNIKANGETYLNEIKEANVTEKSILFTSTAPEGLNINSKIVSEEIEQINEIHSNLTDETATKMGYVNVEAINNKGRRFSTDNNKPIKNTIEKPDNLFDFAKICREKLSELISYL